MELNETSKVNRADMAKLVAHLNELRDELVLLSIGIKDYRAALDWANGGDGVSKAYEVFAKAVKG